MVIPVLMSELALCTAAMHCSPNTPCEGGGQTQRSKATTLL